MKVTLVRIIGDFELQREVELPFVPQVGTILAYKARPGSHIEADDRLEVMQVEWDGFRNELLLVVEDEEGDGPEQGFPELRKALITEFGWHEPGTPRDTN